MHSQITQLSQQITDFCVERTEEVVSRFLPGFIIPGFFCGHRRHETLEGADLVLLLGHLHALGVEKIAGTPIGQAVAKLLRGIDGEATTTFYSYFTAEAVLEFGAFKDNPLFTDFSGAELQNIARATDTTRIYDPETNTLPHHPNNYWAVLARCEFARQRLGILENDLILNRSVQKTAELLFSNSVGFFDDDRHGGGRYDIYSADVYLFAEPFWHLLDQEKLKKHLREHIVLAEKIAMENGASFGFGRSIGALSICLTIELSALSLAQGLATDPARSLNLIANAFEAIKEWFEDGLINAHRHGNTENYRGIQRVLQMTLNCLDKICFSAKQLKHAAPPQAAPASPLFPHIDEFIPFDGKNASVWMFRNERIAFQLPLVDGTCADYAPWLQSPGLFEVPVGSPMYSGVPRIANGHLEYSTIGRPASVEKSENSITVVYENFKGVPKGADQEPLPGRCIVSYRVEGDTVHVEEQLEFEETPQALSFFIPEVAGRPLRVAMKSEQLFQHDTIVTKGMDGWRSCWNPSDRVHQFHFTPAKKVRFAFDISPKIRVRMTPGHEHDYTRALIDSLPADRYAFLPFPPARPMDVRAITEGADILHVGWVEYLFPWPSKDVDQFEAKYHKFIEELGRSPIRIVWTMHNRRPHHMEGERGRRLYRAWAPVVDGVIHHSECGMKLMRGELPYRDGAKHVVIPHGHFGEQMKDARPRAEAETALGLQPSRMRFGLLGRWQKEKQIEMIMAAFTKAAVPGQQLVVTAYDANTPRPDDSRIVFLPRNDWMTREEIATNTHLCDALVSAHTGDTYLTSGIIADAIGVGIPMVVPHWDFFHEMLGDAAFYHDNTEESLAQTFASITPEAIERNKATYAAMQPHFAWNRIGEQTLALYRSLDPKPAAAPAQS